MEGEADSPRAHVLGACGESFRSHLESARRCPRACQCKVVTGEVIHESYTVSGSVRAATQPLPTVDPFPSDPDEGRGLSSATNNTRTIPDGASRGFVHWVISSHRVGLVLAHSNQTRTWPDFRRHCARLSRDAHRAEVTQRTDLSNQLANAEAETQQHRQRPAQRKNKGVRFG
jgi:hypothetical protein